MNSTKLYEIRDAIADQLTEEAHAIWVGTSTAIRDEYAVRVERAADEMIEKIAAELNAEAAQREASEMETREQLYKKTGSLYLSDKIFNMRKCGERVRIVSSPDPERPIAVSNRTVLIGGDAPTALWGRDQKQMLASVRRMMVAERDGRNDAAQAIWDRLKDAEVGW